MAGVTGTLIGRGSPALPGEGASAHHTPSSPHAQPALSQSRAQQEMLWPKDRPGKPPRGACLKGPPAKSQAQAQEDSGRFSPDQRPPPARVSAGASLPQAPTSHEHRQISVERLPAGPRLMATNRAERCSWGGWRLRGGGDLQKSSQDFSRLSHSAPEAGTSPPMPGLPAQPLNPRRGGAGGGGGGPTLCMGEEGRALRWVGGSPVPGLSRLSAGSCSWLPSP